MANLNSYHPEKSGIMIIQTCVTSTFAGAGIADAGSSHHSFIAFKPLMNARKSNYMQPAGSARVPRYSELTSAAALRSKL